MKKIAVLCGLILLGLCLVGAMWRSASSSVVATYAGKTVSREQVLNRVSKNYFEECIDAMIYKDIVLALAKEYNLSASELDLKTYKHHKKEEYGTQASFNQMLSDAGLSEAQFDESCETQYLSQKIRKVIEKQMSVTNSEAYDRYQSDSTFYDQIRARHIVVKTKQEADSIRRRLFNGESFVTLALTYSTDSDTASKGGDLGYFDTYGRTPVFSKVAFMLKVGEVSKPVETHEGFHLIECMDRRVGFKYGKEAVVKAILDDRVTERYNQLVMDKRRIWKLVLFPEHYN